MAENENKKPIPAHVAEQWEKMKQGKKQYSRNGARRNEQHDVFRRIDMHNGDTSVCWEWRGAHGLGTRGEYRPRVVLGKKHYYVYRVVYELYTGHKLAFNEVVRHMCDNSWCCNPTHMLVGTQMDNVQDMLDRERVGMKHFHIKRIMQMLEIGCTAIVVCAKMKESYNMSLDVSIIRKIRMRKVYKHIPWPWGDEWAAKRRARLASVRSTRLAGDYTSAIIDNATTVAANTSEGEEDAC